MHDSFLVHVLERACNLIDVLYDALLLKVDLVLHGLLDDELEVALLGPLDRDEKLIQFVVDEPAQVLDDVWVI